MSYEGNAEYLCAAGHYLVLDCYYPEPPKCEECGGRWAWYHGVDQTNGYDPSRPSTCYAAKAIIGCDDKWHKDHHENDYATELRRYEPAPGSAWIKLNERGQAA